MSKIKKVIIPECARKYTPRKALARNSHSVHEHVLGQPLLDALNVLQPLSCIILRPLALGSAIVSTALICGAAVIFLDGTLFTKDDLVPMIFLMAIALVGFGISLRAFYHVFKGGVSLSPLLTWVSRSLPLLWIAGLGIGYFSATDMIKTQKARADEHRQSTCGALLPEKDGRMNGCLNAVKICDEEANRCKKIGIMRRRIPLFSTSSIPSPRCKSCGSFEFVIASSRLIRLLQIGQQDRYEIRYFVPMFGYS